MSQFSPVKTAPACFASCGSWPAAHFCQVWPAQGPADDPQWPGSRYLDSCARSRRFTSAIIGMAMVNLLPRPSRLSTLTRP